MAQVEDGYKNWNETFQQLTTLLKKSLSSTVIYKSIRWINEGDKPTKRFLSKFTQKSSFNKLSSLYDKEGKITSEPNQVSAITHKFYSNLYSTTNPNKKTQKKFIDSITPVNSKEINIMYPIREEELIKTIKTLPNSKCPGPDGIPYEAYKYNLEFFLPILLNLFNYCLESNQPCPGSTNSITVTLYKKGDPNTLSNWRPISLSNTDSKILAKILDDRLNSKTQNVLSYSQYGFVKNRKILDNIDLLINILQSKRSKGSICFLDQEKAYDRVDLNYLSLCLNYFNIEKGFNKWVYNY